MKLPDLAVRAPKDSAAFRALLAGRAGFARYFHKRRDRTPKGGILARLLDPVWQLALGRALGGEFAAFGLATGAINTGLGVYDVRAYGAIGDGTTDDLASITAAIAAAYAAGGGTVHLPYGNYKISSTVTLLYGVTLRGEGAAIYTTARHTRITLANGANVPMLTNDTTNGPIVSGAKRTQASRIEGITFAGNASNQTDPTAYGIYINAGWEVEIVRCQVNSTYGHGIYVYDSNVVHIVDTHVSCGATSHATAAGVYFYSAADCIMYGCEVGSRYSSVVLTDSGDGTSWKNVLFGNFFLNSFLGYGLEVSGASKGNTIVGNRADQNALAGFYIGASAQGNTFTGNTAMENGYDNTASSPNTGTASPGFDISGTRNVFTGNAALVGTRGNQTIGIRINANADYNEFYGNAVNDNATPWTKNATGTSHTVWMGSASGTLPTNYAVTADGLTFNDLKVLLAANDAKGLIMQSTDSGNNSPRLFLYNSNLGVGSVYAFYTANGTLNVAAGGTPGTSSGTTRVKVTQAGKVSVVSEDLQISTSTKGLVLYDGSHYWRVTVNASGALVTTDLGTTEP